MLNFALLSSGQIVQCCTVLCSAQEASSPKYLGNKLAVAWQLDLASYYLTHPALVICDTVAPARSLTTCSRQRPKKVLVTWAMQVWNQPFVAIQSRMLVFSIRSSCWCKISSISAELMRDSCCLHHLPEMDRRAPSNTAAASPWSPMKRAILNVRVDRTTTRSLESGDILTAFGIQCHGSRPEMMPARTRHRAASASASCLSYRLMPR